MITILTIRYINYILILVTARCEPIHQPSFHFPHNLSPSLLLSTTNTSLILHQHPLQLLPHLPRLLLLLFPLLSNPLVPIPQIFLLSASLHPLAPQQFLRTLPPRRHKMKAIAQHCKQRRRRVRHQRLHRSSDRSKPQQAVLIAILQLFSLCFAHLLGSRHFGEAIQRGELAIAFNEITLCEKLDDEDSPAPNVHCGAPIGGIHRFFPQKKLGSAVAERGGLRRSV